MIREDFGFHPPADSLGLLPIDIRHADEFDLRQAGQNPGMFLAQVPDSDYSYPQAGHQNLRDTGFPSSRLRLMVNFACHLPQESPAQLNIERVAGAIPYQMPVKIVPQQGQVADHVQNFVAGRLVGMMQAIAHRASGTENKQISVSQPFAQALAAKLGRLAFQYERSAMGQLGGKALSGKGLRMDLPADR